MKKVVILICFFITLNIFGCSNKEKNEQQNKTLQNALEKIKQQNDIMQNALDSMKYIQSVVATGTNYENYVRIIGEKTAEMDMYLEKIYIKDKEKKDIVNKIKNISYYYIGAVKIWHFEIVDKDDIWTLSCAIEKPSSDRYAVNDQLNEDIEEIIDFVNKYPELKKCKSEKKVYGYYIYDLNAALQTVWMMASKDIIKVQDAINKIIDKL